MRPRQPRLDAPGTLHHVIGRGINGVKIFNNRKVVKSRRIFCQIAVKKMGYSGADVARFLGINTSAVNRLAVSDELPEVEKYI
jgi:hypothetical protein